jgi:chemotaxis protein MotB
MIQPRANQRDRWLLPYADFVTLLFGVFVMMYAREKSFDKPHAPPVQAVLAQPAASAPREAEPPALLSDLHASLLQEQQEGLLTLSAERRGSVIGLNDQALFKAGEATVQASAEKTFDRIGPLLSRYPNHILLEGHTDSVPIHNNRFQSNWELSTARSMAVMQLLERNYNIPPSRFSIAGSADNAPLSTDNTEPGRARNRRVDIVILENEPDTQPRSPKSESE